MKNILQLALIILSVLSASYGNAQTAKKLPNFQFEDLQGKVVKSADIIYTKYLTVVYFDPDCEHCAAMTEDIVKNISKFKNTKMVWISFGDKKQIGDFQQKYFAGNKNMLFLHDKDMKIFNAYPDAVDTPTVYIYNKSKTQIARYEQPKAADIYKNYK